MLAAGRLRARLPNYIVDSFAGSALLDARVGEYGAAWTKVAASGAVTMSVGSALAFHSNGGGSSMYYASGTPASPNQIVQADVVQKSLLAGASQGITARASTSVLSGYVLRYAITSTVWQLYTFTAGTATLLGSFTQSLTTNQLYRSMLMCIGNQISGWVDGVQVISPVTDNTWTTAGVNGFYTSGGGSVSTGVAHKNFSARQA